MVHATVTLIFLFIQGAVGQNVTTLFTSPPSTSSPENIPSLQILSSASFNGTLIIACQVPLSSSSVQSIEIGKDRAVIASIGSNSQVINYRAGSDVGIDGHLDPRVNNASFLRVDMHNIDCSYTGNYYCSVRSDAIHTVNEIVSVCHDTVMMTLDTPDSFDPTHVVFTCSINDSHTEIANVISMEIRGRERSLIAYADISERNGIVQTVDPYTRRDVQISGQINQTSPLESRIQVDFLTGSCDNAGKYTCHVIYSDRHSAEELYAMDQQVLSNPCIRFVTILQLTSSSSRRLFRNEINVAYVTGPSTLAIAIRQQRSFDPTAFSVTCTHTWYQQTVLDMELSLVPDMPRSGEIRHQVAFWDRFLNLDQDSRFYGGCEHFREELLLVNVELSKHFIQIALQFRCYVPQTSNYYRYSQNQGLTIAQNYVERGFTGSTSGSLTNQEQQNFQIQTSVGVCTDTGVYRCKVVYLEGSTASIPPEVNIAEARLPMCKPGAVYSLTNGSNGDTFRCTVDTTLNITQLFSLEISQITNNSLHVIAFISSFLNDARPVSEFGDVSVSGKIHQFDPTSSYLSITHKVDGRSSRGLTVPTRCKAVYVARSQEIVESLADGTMKY